MPTPQEIAAKIRSHKYGQRRLTSPAALQQYNKKMGADTPESVALKQRIAGDAAVVALVGTLNTQLNAALVAAGGTNPAQPIIKLTSPDEMEIPKNVWLGRINLNTGGMDDTHRTAFQAAEALFADAAGKLRRRIAELFALEKVENDLGNATETPNPGGVVRGHRV